MPEVDRLVRHILTRRKIKNKIVVLCEGDIIALQSDEPLSPHSYAQLETTPDSSFYLNCVPRSWHGYQLPVFFNCGGRSQVIETYSALLEESKDTYLDPQKLYALVDLDIQSAQLPENYKWPTTEVIHEALYDDGLLKSNIDKGHRFWVTALVHKEAFFVLPSVTSAWSENSGAHFQGQPIDLRAFYRSIAEAIPIRNDNNPNDVDINLSVVQARLARFQHGKTLTCKNPEELCKSWLAAFSSATSDEYESLVRTLVSVAKVKPFWEQIDSGLQTTGILSAETFRDQLALKIARCISDLPANAHPLAGFFAWLAPRR